jgi:hypothetical protein
MRHDLCGLCAAGTVQVKAMPTWCGRHDVCRKCAAKYGIRRQNGFVSIKEAQPVQTVRLQLQLNLKGLSYD